MLFKIEKIRIENKTNQLMAMTPVVACIFCLDNLTKSIVYPGLQETASQHNK
jgi:hypothetical protein